MHAPRHEWSEGMEPLHVIDGERTQEVGRTDRPRLQDNPFGGITLGAILSLVFFWIPVAVIGYLFTRS